MMIVMGKISGRFDARLLIAIGAMVTVSAAGLLFQINPDTSTRTLFWPLILRSIGSVMMFLPLSLATLGDLPKSDVAAGSGFYSLTRQLGSSIGIAIITTVLAHREAVHRAILVEKISLYNQVTQWRLEVLGQLFAQHSPDSVTGRHQALQTLDNLINSQATLLSFAEIFLYVGLAFIASLPLLLLLGKGGGNRAAAADVH